MLLQTAESLPDGRHLRQILVGLLRSGAPKILLWGKQFRAFVNNAYAEFDPTVEIGRSGEPLASLMPETWLQLRHSLRSAMRGTERLKIQVVLDKPAPPASGSLRYTAYLTPIYSEGSKPKGVLIDAHEASEDRPLSQRLFAENQHLQKLFGELPVLVAYIEGKGLRLRFVNLAFRRVFGFRPLEGLAVAEAIPEADEHGILSVMRNAIQSGRTQSVKRTPLRTRSPSKNSPRYIDFTFQPVPDAAGRPVGVLCLGIDATEAHREAQEQDSLMHRTLHASRLNAMGAMAMTLAHELNQPLAAAASYLSVARRQIMKSTGETGEAIDMLDRGVEQIKRAGKIIQHTTPLILTGRASRKPVSLSKAVSNALSLLAGGREIDLKVTTKIPADADIVLADEVQLEQVLINLFRNASEASRHADRKEIRVVSQRMADQRVSISVRDFASGLKGGEEGLFEIGSQGSRGGLGFGLPLSRTLVEANGGTLTASNAAGGGAEFRLVLDCPDAEGRPGE